MGEEVRADKGLKLEGQVTEESQEHFWHGFQVFSTVASQCLLKHCKVWLFLWTSSISSSHTYHLNLDAQGGQGWLR